MKCGLRLIDVPQAESRKPVSVLFNDVAESTAMGERLEPESLRRVMWRYYETVARVCERHGGVVEKFIGDAAMAVFGIPAALEDHALRAVRAASDLRSEIDHLNDELEREWGVRLATRTGINSGEVIAGDPAGGQALVTGDAVNVAARLEQSAAPGQVLIGAATYALVEGSVKAEPVAPLQVRGKTERLQAWDLAEVLTTAGQAARPAATSRMLGRDEELRVLRRAFEQVSRDRTPRLITVMGQAGIGKSRLARELGTELSRRASVHSGHCLPYGEGVTFWPFTEIVRSAAGPDPRAAIEELLAAERRPAALADRVLQAAGMEEGLASGPDVTWAVRAWVEALAHRRPVVLVFEDVHWAEPPLLDLIEHLGMQARDAPLLILCMARDELLERRPDWPASGPRAETMTLDPLPAAAVSALIDELPAGEAVSEELRAQVVERAAGNPLFIEQMVALLKESPDAEGRVAIPPTIQALLSARLDRLPPAERTAIGAAAVVGAEFWSEAVEALEAGTSSANASEALGSLARRELIDRADAAAGAVPGEGFAFHHALIRDAAYGSLPKRTRAELHERLAGWLERHPDAAIADEAVLGHHLEQAYGYRVELAPEDDHARALASQAADHLAAAGRRASSAREDATAVTLLTRAEQLLQPGSPDRRGLMPLIAGAMEGTANHARAGKIYEQALAQALRAGDAWVEGRARLGRAHVWFVAEPDVSVEQIASETERALTLLQPTGDRQGLADGWRLMGEARMYDGRAADGRQALERALDRIDPDASPRSYNAVSFALGMCLLEGPDPLDAAVAFAVEHLDEARARGLRSLEGDMLHVLGIAEGRRARFENGRAALRAAAEISEDLGLRYMGQWANRSLGQLELNACEPAAAEQALRASYEVLVEMGLNGSLSESCVLLADALLTQGRLEDAAEMLDEVKDEWVSGDASTEAPRLAVRARLLAAEGHAAESQAVAEQALRLVRSTDWTCLHADVLLATVEVLRAGGAEKHDAAEAALREAVRIAAGKGYEAAVAKARALDETAAAPARPG